MSTPTLLAFSILGFFAFSFLFWRRLKEDHPSPVIFTVSIVQLATIALSVLVSNHLLAPQLKRSILIEPSGLWFWVGFVSLTIAQLLVGRLSRVRFFEVFEASIASLLTLFLLYYSFQLISQSSPIMFIVVGTIFGLIFLYYLLDHSYKQFAWYKSGRIGFSALSVFALFFLLRSIAAYFAPEPLLLFGKIDTIFSSTVALVAFLSLYNLSQHQ